MDRPDIPLSDEAREKAVVVAAVVVVIAAAASPLATPSPSSLATWTTAKWDT